MAKDYEKIRREVEERHKHDAPQPLPKKKSGTSDPRTRDVDAEPASPGEATSGNADPKSILPPNTLGI